MADSFQKEIPKARVNIALDVETGGNRKKVELPLKMLVVGDFSNGKSKGRVAERERTNLNKGNFEAVLRDLSPEARFEVPNELARDGSEIAVNLKFDAMKAFHPDRVANQIPEMHSMLAMRNLLKDLKANLLDNAGFRKELEKIVKDQPELAELKGQLEQILGPVPVAGGE
ncbi:type VI secretion system contractile sheath small subunit [Geoalkalibacter sp.]|uniref:type VI secretion system contractile sheath small subunit n=1 Tax=Geoalkalibacter sp. TaxID=3041440 RepID=UPI00272E2046|nr:type VI secretion system contractile sheath small subunit [Geoalkalibacter sp.]